MTAKPEDVEKAVRWMVENDGWDERNAVAKVFDDGASFADLLAAYRAPADRRVEELQSGACILVRDIKTLDARLDFAFERIYTLTRERDELQQALDEVKDSLGMQANNTLDKMRERDEAVKLLRRWPYSESGSNDVMRRDTAAFLSTLDGGK